MLEAMITAEFRLFDLIETGHYTSVSVDIEK